MKKKIISYFLLFALSVQILPVRQIGGILFSSQLTEEVPHANDLDNCSFCKEPIKKDYLSNYTNIIGHSFEVALLHHHLMDDAIPNNHATDIHVPPPNC